jgi:hypothetical protein
MEEKEGILENCKICHLGIRHIDDYAKVQDFIKGNLYRTIYFHRECYRNTFNPLNQVQQLAKQAQKIISEVS